MPITVRHDSDPGFAADLTYALAEEQARRAQQAKRAQELAALAQLLAARQAPPSEAVIPSAPSVGASAEVPTQSEVPIDPRLELARENNAQRQREAVLDNQAKRAAAFYAAGADRFDTGRGDQAIASIINNVIDSQSAGGRQQAALQAGLLREQMGMGHDFRMEAMQGNVQLRNNLLSQELPPDLLEGLQSGSLKYTRDQQREMQEILDSIAKADHASNLTPEERLAFQRQQAQRYNDIRYSPQPVPPDQRPQTPQQIADQLFVKGPDGQLGTLEIRNGEQRVVPWKSEQEQRELKQQEMRQKEQEFLWKRREADEKQAREVEKDRLDFDRDFFKSELDNISDMRKAELEAIKSMEPDRLEFEEPGPTGPDGKEGQPKFDKAGYDAEMAKYRTRQELIFQKYQPMMEALRQRYFGDHQPGAAPQGTSAPSGAAPSSTPASETADNAQIIGPNAAGEYAKKYPDGRIEILPKGFAP